MNVKFLGGILRVKHFLIRVGEVHISQLSFRDQRRKARTYCLVIAITERQQFISHLIQQFMPKPGPHTNTRDQSHTVIGRILIAV